MNYQHIKDTTKAIKKTLLVIDMAIKKREIIRTSQFYSMFGYEEDLKRELRFMDAVIQRLEYRIKRLIKQLEE